MAKDKAARKRGMRENATLIRRFLPYFRPYSRTLALDLFFAALTTLCDLALPLIVRYFTGSAETLTGKRTCSLSRSERCARRAACRMSVPRARAFSLSRC